MSINVGEFLKCLEICKEDADGNQQQYNSNISNVKQTINTIPNNIHKVNCDFAPNNINVLALADNNTPNKASAVWFDLKDGPVTFTFQAKISSQSTSQFGIVIQKDSNEALGEVGEGCGFKGIKNGIAYQFFVGTNSDNEFDSFLKMVGGDVINNVKCGCHEKKEIPTMLV
ncbi:hypothetical protein EIN_258130 [Entamoeba invadens IP1]|uniref:Uncharacterized protein n=1 Tax=Entamoeba invadens IP1 TaxID=370355 RepID=A0A0A1TV40_ENTIV|nr:hypothetical protein EIN_258130 [Entamoeba invadens IP1]ELP84189.1 hypothetical protein EIN_258130 [Entamoeba invadens IP1]|eukprot:XP_004183535.1 hypothetical protein EIN_258130 [Entamoeba invadens IP1]